VKEPDFEPPDSNLYVVSARGGEVTEIASIDGPIRKLSLSPDGGRIAFIGEINRDGAPCARIVNRTCSYKRRTWLNTEEF